MSQKSHQKSSVQLKNHQTPSCPGETTLVSLLRQARVQAGFAQRQLADRMDTSLGVIRRLEEGLGSVRLLIRVMEALEFSLAGLPRGSSLGQKLSVARERRKFDRTRLAERANVDETAIARLEADEGEIADLLRVLDVLAPNIRRRAPERTHWGQADKESRDSRFTPASFMENIYTAFGEIDLDPCAHPLSPVVARRKIILAEGGDGLRDEWSGSLAFVNPPYSALLTWLRRTHEQWQAGKIETAICLVPVRTDSAFFHDTLSRDADIFLLRGRVKFLNSAGKDQATPFSLMLLALGSTADQRQRYEGLAGGFWLPRRS